MHKALAKAWRDLKLDGQKPYFIEYEKNREKYLEKVNYLKSDADRAAMSGAGKRGARALSAASSIVPASNYDAPLSPAPGSTNDEQEEPPQQPGGGGGFTAVNR